MVDFILSYISYKVILNLPLIIQIPGLFILAFFAYRGIQAVMSLKPIKAVISIFMFIAVAVILSRFGNAFAALITGSTA